MQRGVSECSAGKLKWNSIKYSTNTKNKERGIENKKHVGKEKTNNKTVGLI